MGALPEEDQSSRVMLLSADCHAGPRVKQFREFLDPEFRQAFDEYAAAVSVLEEAPLHTSDDLAEATRGQLRLERDHVAGLADPSARVSDLDADGIAAEIIFPQGSVPFHRYPPQAQAPARSVTNHFDPRLRRAGVRAYNRWLAEFCAANTGRHLGIAVVPIDDVAAAVQEVEWARDAGLRSVSLPPISDAYPHYNDACYEPFWEACAVLNMPLQAHGASTVWYGTGPDHYALTLAECDFFTRRSLWFLIFSGVFDRHPDLNLVFTEQRAGWVVQTLADMDSIYEFQPSGLQQILAQRPSWYFAAELLHRREFPVPRRVCPARPHRSRPDHVGIGLSAHGRHVAGHDGQPANDVRRRSGRRNACHGRLERCRALRRRPRQPPASRRPNRTIRSRDIEAARR